MEYYAAIKRNVLYRQLHRWSSNVLCYYAEWTQIQKADYQKKKRKEVWLLYDSLKCQNYRDRKQYSGSQGLGVGEGVEYSGVAQGIILVVGTVTVVKLYLSKFMELYTSKRMNFMCPSTFCHTEY